MTQLPTHNVDRLARAMTRKRVAGKYRLFLEALSRSPNISAACRAAGLSRTALYERKAADPEFARQWDEIEQASIDALETEAWRRSAAGYDEFVVSSGRLVVDPQGKPIMQRRYSDGLMALLLKAHRPEKFRDNATLKHVGPDGGAIQTKAVVIPATLKDLSVDELARLYREAADQAH